MIEASLNHPLPNALVTFLGDSLRLNCRGSGFPPPEHIWRKISGDDAPLNYSREIGNLVISMATLRHSGVYECVISNTIRGMTIAKRDTVKITIIGNKNDRATVSIQTMQ